MSEMPQVPVAQQRVLYELAEAAEVVVRRNLEFPAADGEALPFDLYLPPQAARRDAGGPPWPVVVLGEGYPEAGFVRVVGCAFREMGPIVSWARLIAASGMAVVAGSNRSPAEDARALLRFVRAEGARFGLDARRVGIWAASGNGPVGLSLAIEGGAAIRCAALLYPFLLDLDGTEVADAAATFRFANACAGRSLDDLPAATALLVARAGREETPGLNASLDRFVARALERNLPLTLINHAQGPHAFDLVDDGATTRAAVGQTLAFLGAHLLDPGAGGTA
jgi:hypothetical protein